MGLKFRRGSTAQQSGSLAFGEPYVNTTLGTLVVGGATGDIILSSTGTGSTGNFGAISGSGLDITGNANVAGNLTLGGKLTIGDASSDTVNVVASLSSSLIPSVTNAFDLGSENYFWRDLYISTGSIKFVGATGTVVGTLSNAANGMILDSGIVANGNSSFGTSSLAITSVTGSLAVNGRIIANSITGAIAATNGVISGSSQVEFNTINNNPFSQSATSVTVSKNIIPTTLTLDLGSAEKPFKDLYLSSASLYIDGTQVLSSTAAELIFSTDTGQSIKFNELGTDNIILQTVDGDIELKSSGGGDVLLDPTNGLVAVRGTLQIQDGHRITSSGATSILFGNDVIVSGSITTTGNINGVNLSTFSSSINTTIKNKLDADGVISGSSQITLSGTTGFSAYSTSVDSRITTEKGRVDAILSASAADKDSFAEIVELINSVDTTNDQSFASFYTASVGRLNNLELTSASVNISVSNLNTYTGSNDTTNTTQNTRLTALEASASTALSTNNTQATSISNLNSATASLLIETANLESFSSSALTRLSALEVETSNLESFTSSINTTIKSKLDADGVISGSAQLTTTFDARYLNTGGDSVVSGSSQIAFSGVTGTVSNAQLANSAITIAGTSTSLGGTISAATIGNAIGAFSGSAQVAHDSTTGYSANRHIDHTAVSISAGSGLSGGGDISATRTLSIASGGVTNDMLAGSIANAKLTNSTISGIALGSNLATLTIGTGLSGTSYNGSTGVTIANTGVTSNVAGTGISVNSGTGAVTITNTGVTSNVAGTGVTVSGGTGAVTISIGQAVATTSNVRFGSIGVGMDASGTSGRIDAANDVVAFSSSDIRFKENIKPIENALDKISKISGNTYDWKEENKIEHGYEGNDVGVIAQEIEAVLPQLVQTRESGYKAVKYDKLVALLIEGIKEQQIQIDNLTIQVEELKKQKGL
jgi:hypothetical protein